MKSEQISSGRQEKVTANWEKGVNTLRNPWNLPEDQAKWAVNCTVRGSIFQTRPGQAQRLSLPPGNLQGGSFFAANKQAKAPTTTTTNNQTITYDATIFNYTGGAVNATELDYLVFAVDGSVYFAPFPLEQPTDWNDYKLNNITLDPNAQELSFCIATQSAALSSGANPTTQITPSHNIVVIQDGVNQPAYWDGSDSNGAHSTTMPTGFWMAYSGERLWVATGNLVIASDLANPLAWTEWQSGAGRGSFSFPRPVTGMIGYVEQNTSESLFVFTDQKTYTLASGILDRSTWETTPNFQSTVYPTVGCIAGKSLVFQAGMLWWYSSGGLVSADVAAASYLSSQVLYKDAEMNRIKRLTPGDLSSTCAASFENYMLISIPYLEVLPSQTMVLDYAPASEWNEGRIPAWCGVWNGTRPIEWTKGIVNQQNRIFHFSVDYAPCNNGSYNSVWECFLPERIDSYLRINPDGTTTSYKNRIYCQMETALLGDGLDMKELQFGEVHLTQLGGTVDVQVSYRGCRGAYKPILNRRYLGLTEDYQFNTSGYEEQIAGYGILRNQYRKIVTQGAIRDTSTPSCESKYAANIDKAFSFLVEWCGECGVEAVRMYLNPWSEKSQGTPDSDETSVCVVEESGQSILLNLPPNPDDGTAAAIQDSFVAQSTQSYTDSCTTFAPSITATATASYISYVSNADALAQAAARALLAATNAAKVARQLNPC